MADAAIVERATFRYGKETTEMLLTHGMDECELQRIFQYTFNLDACVVGFSSPEESTIFPFSFLCRAPAYFKKFGQKNPLVLVLKDYTTGERTDTLMEIVRSGILERVQIADIAEDLEKCSAHKVLSRGAFKSLARKILRSSESTLVPNNADRENEDYTTKDISILDKLFATFDSDRSGFVDTDEMLCALTLLCSGNRDEKLRVGFNLYKDENDCVTESSLVAYLRAMFMVMHATDASKFDAKDMTVSELARATARRCFAETVGGRTSGDGPSIDFDKFKNWYTKGFASEIRNDDINDAEIGKDEGMSPFGVASRELARRRREALAKEDDRAIKTRPVAGLRRAVGLSKCSPQMVVTLIAKETDDEGRIGISSYMKVFAQLVRCESEQLRNGAIALFRSITEDDDDDAVDVIELLTCMCFLASGNLRERLLRIFAIYDLASARRVQSPSQTTPLLLALLRLPLRGAASVGEALDRQRAASRRVREEEREHGAVSFAAFLAWFRAFVDVDDAESAHIEAEGSHSLNAEDARLRKAAVRQFCLDQLVCDELFDILSERCSLLSEGITRRDFVDSLALVGRMAGADDFGSAESRALAEALYESFDANDDGVLDRSELASGVASLYAKGI